MATGTWSHHRVQLRSEGAIMEVRRHAGTNDTRAVQELASREWPRGWHPGGLGWALARGQLAEQVVLFEEDSRLVAWVGVGMDEPDDHLVQVDGEHPEVADAAVAWLRAEVDAGPARFEVADGEAVVSSTLARAGLGARGPVGEVLGLRRPATGAAPDVPAGYSVRAVRPEELDVRVEVHRAAWRPGDLPDGARHGPPAAPGATSSFTRSAYDAVRATWLYDAELDLVVVDPDGVLAACCIAWFDPGTGVAEIEPMGVTPQHRGKGLAVTLCHEVARRVDELGGSEIFINTGPRAEYPAPGRAYLKAGFEVFTRAHTVVG